MAGESCVLPAKARVDIFWIYIKVIGHKGGEYGGQ